MRKPQDDRCKKRPFYPTGHPDERSEEGPPSIKLQTIELHDCNDCTTYEIERSWLAFGYRPISSIGQ
jgi:hypothetical protein